MISGNESARQSKRTAQELGLFSSYKKLVRVVRKEEKFWREKRGKDEGA